MLEAETLNGNQSDGGPVTRSTQASKKEGFSHEYINQHLA